MTLKVQVLKYRATRSQAMCGLWFMVYGPHCSKKKFSQFCPKQTIFFKVKDVRFEELKNFQMRKGIYG